MKKTTGLRNTWCALFSSALAALATPAAFSAEAATTGADIAGISLGMEREAALAAAQRLHPGTKPVTSRVVYEGEPQVPVTFFDSFGNAPGPENRLKISWSGPPGTPKVTSVIRKSTFTEKPAMKSLADSLLQKYGNPAHAQGSRYVWLLGENKGRADRVHGRDPIKGCTSINIDLAISDQSPAQLFGQAAARWSNPQAVRNIGAQLGWYEGCGKILMVTLHPASANSDLVSVMTASLIDHDGSIKAMVDTARLIGEAGNRLRAEQTEKAKGNEPIL